jgi:F0F1-type ATP synthase assembly protein I
VSIGWWLDDKFATTPLFLLLGTLLGAGGGFYKLYRTLMDLDERRKREDGR